MSDFGDQLRGTLAKRAVPATNAEPPPETEPQRSERCRAIERRYAEADARAAALCREVFLPLLAEFQEVLEGDGLLAPGTVRQERVLNGEHWAAYAAVDSASGKRFYDFRFLALAYRDGPLVIWAECRHDATRDCRRRLPRTPLVEPEPAPITLATARIDVARIDDARIDVARIDDARIDAAAARQWCAEILKRAAEAVVEAVFAPDHPPAAAMPIVVPPLAGCASVPTMV